MLQSMGSHRVRHDLATEQQAGSSRRNSVWSFPGDLKEGKACNIQLFLVRPPDRDTAGVVHNASRLKDLFGRRNPPK